MDLSLSFRCFSSAQQAKDALSVKPFLARKEAQQAKIANQRKDDQFKPAKQLSEEYAWICVENLNLKAMRAFSIQINLFLHEPALQI